MLELVDSHSHIDVAEFEGDRDEVVRRARERGVTRQIVPAIQASTWPALRDLCAREAGLHAAYGLHPMYLDAHLPSHLDDLAGWLARSDCVAVGECGLDFHVEGLDPARQREIFERQVQYAREFELPLVIHARRAVDEVIATLRRLGPRAGGVVHSFPGSHEQALQLFKLGFCLGFGGPITYERARRLRDVVARMPLEFLLLETDSPDQPLCGHQGARNEPMRLVEVLEAVASIRGIDAARVAEQTTANASRIFPRIG